MNFVRFSNCGKYINLDNVAYIDEWPYGREHNKLGVMLIGDTSERYSIVLEGGDADKMRGVMREKV